MLDLTRISFEEFNNSIEDLNWRLDLIIDDGDWQILRDKQSEKFFINALYSNDFYEVEPVAKLEYDATCDILCRRTDIFDYDEYDFGGEQKTENKIIYWWFKEVVPELN